MKLEIYIEKLLKHGFLQQINQKEYHAELKQRGLTSILNSVEQTEGYQLP